MNKQTKLTIFIFCIVKLTLHLIADYHSGFQGDELLHIETGNHLAFGYMEFPPMIGLLAFIQNLFHSHSVFVYHIFPYIAMLLIIIYLGKIAVELGGKSIAVFIALFCLLVAPGFEGSQQPFGPLVFSQLFWVLCLEVIPVTRIYSKYASREGWVVQTIYVCKKPKQSFNKMKELFKTRIFE